MRLQEVISAAHLEVSTAPKVFKGRPSYGPLEQCCCAIKAKREEAIQRQLFGVFLKGD